MSWQTTKPYPKDHGEPYQSYTGHLWTSTQENINPNLFVPLNQYELSH